MSNADLSKFTDSDGFIGHLDVDGRLEFGDSSQRTFMYLFLSLICSPTGIKANELKQRLYMCYKKIRDNKGEPVRHPDFTRWYGQKGTFSRDQAVPLIACAALFNEYIFRDFSKRLLKRFCFFWNTKHIGQHSDKWKIPDFAGPKVWAMMIRGEMNFIPLGFIFWPLLLILDAFLIIDALVRVIVPLFDRDNVGDDLNFTVLLIFCKKLYPTPFSFIARHIYFFRPLAGDKQFRKDNQYFIGPATAFMWYFRHPNCPPLDKIAIEAIIQEL